MERRKCVTAARLQPGDPLWRRVPTSDPAGQNLSDFMLLIPGLKRWAQHRRERLLEELRGVFERHADRVVFADLMWISHRQGKGVALALFEAIRERIPEALLVASQAEVQRGLQQQARRGGIRRRLGRDGS
jgi:hypothetical protein